MLVAVDGTAVGAIEVTDTLKQSAPGAVARLRAMGLHTILLTGDRQGAAAGGTRPHQGWAVMSREDARWPRCRRTS